MKNAELIELQEQYRTMFRSHPTDRYLVLLGIASGVALEECYTDAERGKRLRVLFQVWEEENNAQ